MNIVDDIALCLFDKYLNMYTELSILENPTFLYRQLSSIWAKTYAVTNVSH